MGHQRNAKSSRFAQFKGKRDVIFNSNLLVAKRTHGHPLMLRRHESRATFEKYDALTQCASRRMGISLANQSEVFTLNNSFAALQGASHLVTRS